MKKFIFSAALLASATAIYFTSLTVLSKDTPRGPNGHSPEIGHDRHVFILHIDGFQRRVFQAMLAAGQLPHFEFLMKKGSSTMTASTVDKSETMKVIPSVLSSKVDTHLTAWWQFDRDTLGFRNFWIEPLEVVNYALGMDFPLYPTVIDAVAKDGHPDTDIVAGFNLYRRGVPIENYTRIYGEGYDAVYSHRYYKQSFATTTELIAMLHAKAGLGVYPRLILGLLAPIDEMIHLNGVTKLGETRTEYCFDRGEGKTEPADDVIDRIPEFKASGLISTQFTKTEKTRLCLKAPSVSIPGPDGKAQMEKVYPEVALAFIAADLNLGRMINALREIRLDGERASLQKVAPGLNGLKGPEQSAFEKTLFLVYSDHGMSNTFHLMNPKLNFPAEDANRNAESLSTPFAAVLADHFQLRAFVGGKWTGPGQKIVMDYQNLPMEFAHPERFPSWQSPSVINLVKAARAKSEGLFSQAEQIAKATLHNKYWYLIFLQSLLVDPKLEKAAAKARPMALEMLNDLLLQGQPEFRRARREQALKYLRDHVGMVYGGGALNNAELFLPHFENGTPNWNIRPSFKEILDSYDGSFLDRLTKTPGVGLVFIRKENGQIAPNAVLPEEMHIAVYDTHLNRGEISIRRDQGRKNLLFKYRTETPVDPLSMGGNFNWGTYQEWNDRSLQQNAFQHNVVAGIGSYLYSNTAASGDVLIMHAHDWNFGENLAGHGGLEAEEKLAPMIAYGPGVKAGAQLRSKCLDQTYEPTVLDVAPTALAHLGYPVVYGEGELTRFSRSGFADYLKNWREGQVRNCASNGHYILDQTLKKMGYPAPSELKPQITDLVNALCPALESAELPPLPDYNATKEDGCLLDLAN